VQFLFIKDVLVILILRGKFIRFFLLLKLLLMGLNCSLLCNIDSIDLGVVCIIDVCWFFLSFLVPLMWPLEFLPLGFNVDLPPSTSPLVQSI
jgi:hypothetical protein